MTFIIEDWAGNVLNFKGRFQKPQVAVPMEFVDWDDAEIYLDAIGVTEDDRGEYYILEKGEKS